MQDTGFAVLGFTKVCLQTVSYIYIYIVISIKVFRTASNLLNPPHNLLAIHLQPCLEQGN